MELSLVGRLKTICLTLHPAPGKVSFQATVPLEVQVQAEVSLVPQVTLTLAQYSQYCPHSTLAL